MTMREERDMMGLNWARKIAKEIKAEETRFPLHWGGRRLCLTLFHPRNIISP